MSLFYILFQLSLIGFTCTVFPKVHQTCLKAKLLLHFMHRPTFIKATFLYKDIFANKLPSCCKSFYSEV